MQVYFVPHVMAVDGPKQAAMLGARWLAQHQAEGIPFILVPTNGQATNNDIIRELVETGVRWGIPRNFPSADWAGGPVLAPWANAKVIECLGRWSERITSVCVLKWIEEDNQDWLTAHEAIDVTAPNRVPPSPTIDDGVVLGALEDVTRHGQPRYRPHSPSGPSVRNQPTRIRQALESRTGRRGGRIVGAGERLD